MTPDTPILLRNTSYLLVLLLALWFSVDVSTFSSRVSFHAPGIFNSSVIFQREVYIFLCNNPEHPVYYSRSDQLEVCFPLAHTSSVRHLDPKLARSVSSSHLVTCSTFRNTGTLNKPKHRNIPEHHGTFRNTQKPGTPSKTRNPPPSPKKKKQEHP